MTLLSYRYLALHLLFAVLCGCGGGGSGGGGNNTFTSIAQSDSSRSSIPSSQSSFSSSQSSSSKLASVKLSGVITYDYVPHNESGVGLNYLATVQKPVRGAVIELIDEAGAVVKSSATNNLGEYSFLVDARTTVKVRVKAQLRQMSGQTLDISVEDNTKNNSLYVMEGNLFSVGSEASIRNLNAPSGWDGSDYSSDRVAAPFAILDAIYIGVNRLNLSGNTLNYPSLHLLWSPENIAAEGDVLLGEIGTTSYDGNNNSIYILGESDSDTDEYDAHVLLHEWGHYVERNFSRSDSIGGDHGGNDYLDMRVAMSEGFANGFAGIMLDQSQYMDATGIGQSTGFVFDVSKKHRGVKGYYSEGSIASLFYNYYASSENKTMNDFSPIYKAISHADYRNSQASTSIFLFYDQLKSQSNQQSLTFKSLMLEQNITGEDKYGEGELNHAGLDSVLPVYKKITVDSSSVNVCSLSDFGKYNKLANSQFLRVSINASGEYLFSAEQSGGSSLPASPEMLLYDKGVAIMHVESAFESKLSQSIALNQGDYILEVYDLNNHDSNDTSKNTYCFDMRVTTKK